MTVYCDECGKPIRTTLCFARWSDGKFVYVCKRCSRAMVDEHTANGLMMVVNSVNDDEAAYEFEIQAARKGEE